MDKILELKKRYGQKIKHHGDCEIYRSVEVYGYAFCDCGLLHDLSPLDYNEIKEIYPDYNKDIQLQYSNFPFP